MQFRVAGRLEVRGGGLMKLEFKIEIQTRKGSCCDWGNSWPAVASPQLIGSSHSSKQKKRSATPLTPHLPRKSSLSPTPVQVLGQAFHSWRSANPAGWSPTPQAHNLKITKRKSVCDLPKISRILATTSELPSRPPTESTTRRQNGMIATCSDAVNLPLNTFSNKK